MRDRLHTELVDFVQKCFKGSGRSDQFIPFMHASVEVTLQLLPSSHALLLAYARVLFSMANEESGALKDAAVEELHEILLLSLQYHFVPVVRLLLNSYASLASPTPLLEAASLVASVVAASQTLGKVHAEMMAPVTDWVMEKATEWRKKPAMQDIASVFGLREDALPSLQFLFLAFVHILATQLRSRSANTQFVFALCYSLLILSLVQMSLKRNRELATDEEARGDTEQSGSSKETASGSNEMEIVSETSEKIRISGSKVKVIASALSGKESVSESTLSSENPMFMNLRLLFVASEIHAFLARYDNNGCVCNHGCLPFLNLFIVSLCFSTKDLLVYKEMRQCFQCGLSIYTKGRNMLSHSVRQQCTMADMLPLDARVLFNLRCLIDHDSLLKDYVRQLNQTLIEWGDIACRKMGRGPVTREAILLGIYSTETMQIVNRLLAFRTTPIARRDVDELVKELKLRRFDVMSRIFLMKIQDQINWTKRDGLHPSYAQA